MWALGQISSIAMRPGNDIKECRTQPDSSTNHRTQVASERCTQCRPGDCCGQRQNIGQIRSTTDAANRDCDLYTITNISTDCVFDPIGFRATAEHLGKMLPSASALFMAAPASALLYFHVHPFAIQGTYDGLNSVLFGTHAYQRLSEAVSSKGRSFPATASRARKIRERTVPMGQSMMPAISS